MKTARVGLALAFALASAPALALRPEGAAVILERDVYFSAESGKKVLVAKGNYYIGVGEKPPLLIMREFEEDALRVTALIGKHEEKLREPRAESIAAGETGHHLLLLLPDGRSIDASGWVGEVAPRSGAPLDAAAIKRHTTQREQRRLITRRAALEPREADEKPERTTWEQGLFKDQIIVKVHDGAAIRATVSIGDGAATTLTFDAQQCNAERLQRQGLTVDQARQDTAALVTIFAGPTVSRWGPLFERDPLFLQDDREQAEQLSGSEHGDLENYFLLVLGNTEKAEELVNRLNAVASVEIAYFAPVPQDADIPPETPNLETKQRYLDPAPEGIDARYAWTQRGGRGDGWRVIDIEQGWNFDHEDFPGRFFPDLRYKRHKITAGTNTTACGSRQHGTAVLGEMVGLNDDRGVTGIVANAGWGAVSPMRDYSGEKKLATPVYRIPEAINVAASMLTPGDAILIEQHMVGPNVQWSQPTPGNWVGVQWTDTGQPCTCNCGQFGFIPMEYEKATFDSIKNATARGIYVIEAAGNGDADLAHTRYRLKKGGKSRFDRSVRDSGAILVGASKGASRDPECFTNHGAMVDVHSWGNSVVTTGYGLNQCTSGPIANSGWEVNGPGDDKQWYTATFSGTSSASPIVTGAVLSISGVRRAAGKPALTPAEMRALLKANGTPQGTGGAHGTKLIGPQPDLKKALPKAIASTGSGGSAPSLADVHGSTRADLALAEPVAADE